MRALLMTILMLFGATAASAQVFEASELGDTITLDFTGTDGDLPDDPIFSDALSGTVTITLVDILDPDAGDDTWIFRFDMTNTSSGTEEASKMTSLGFTTLPAITSEDQVDILQTYDGFDDGVSVFDSVVLDTFSAHGVQMDLVCATDGSNTCEAASGGLRSVDWVDGGNGGEHTDIFFMSIVVADGTDMISFSDFFLRFGSLNTVDCIDTCSGSGVGIPTIVSVVPEPSTWVMMIVGFGMVASFGRRRRRALAQVA